MLETDDHHGYPPEGREMRVRKDIRKEFATQYVVNLIESEQNPEYGSKEQVNHRRRDITVQPIPVTPAAEDTREIVDLDGRRQNNENCRKNHCNPARYPEVKNHSDVADEHQQELRHQPAQGSHKD